MSAYTETQRILDAAAAKSLAAPLPQRITLMFSKSIEPYEFVKGLTQNEQRALLHAICSEGVLPIGEVRSICNSEGYSE